MNNKKIELEDILCLFVILCPVFDILSFAFRNIFKTNISISTFLRPIIPVCVSIYIFIKGSKKEKIFFTALGSIYVVYGIIHLFIMKSLITGASYGNVLNEAQYILNFTFLMIYFVIYLYVFIYRNKEVEKLKKSITIMCFIYIISIAISIITRTSSYTYQETMTGFKGWIESGNSLSAILLLSLIIVLCQIKSSTSIYTGLTFIMTAIYLTTMIGTRTGLIGTFLITAIYFLLEIIFSKNKKIIAIGLSIMVVFALIIGIFGSSTIRRRKQMNSAKHEIFDEKTNEIGTMTGDMLRIKNKILDNELENSYMSEAQKQSVLDLYKYSKKHNFAGNDTRRQQLIYNMYLVKNQKNALAILFGNGYKTNFREMVMENDLASIFLNFGVIGFILYVFPLIAILIYSIYVGVKNIRKINTEFVMYQVALALALALSWMSGYVLFATSSMIVIVVICTLLLNETQKMSNFDTRFLRKFSKKS